MNISPHDYMHPEDKAAIENLKNVPVFSSLVKAFVKTLPEPLFHGMNMAHKILLGPQQLPNIYNLLPPICEILNIEVPELYLEMNPAPDAYTYGDSKNFVTISSGLIEYLDEDELRSALAHECGHIACHHVLYHTMASMFIQFGSKIFGALATVAAPVTLALLHWQRRSELSADRAASIVMGDVTPVVRTMIRLAGGPKSITSQVNIDLYVQQADAFDKLIETSLRDKLLQDYAIMDSTHPFHAVRTREILRWGEGQQFHSIINARQQGGGDQRDCSFCHMAIKEGWKFCHYCGNPITIES